MPIWDEEWRLDGNDVYLGAVGPSLQAGFGDGLDRDRAKLAAAAPAMARLLLELEWAGHDPYADDYACPSCEWPQGRTKEHHPECAWLAVMRAAGVRE